MAHKFNPINIKKLDNEWRRENLPPFETLQKLGVEATDVFADIGCGIGYFTIPAATMTKNNVYALDTSAAMLEELKIRANEADLENVVLTQTAEYDLRLPDESITFALLVNVIHEIDNKEKFLTEINRILKTGGKLAVIDWEKAELEMGPPISHRIGKDTLAEMLKEIKFDCQKIMSFTENFYGLVFIKN